MPYTVRFPDYKSDDFLKIFCDFSEMRRLGYLKPSPCKGSRSELFTNSLPRKGMETSLYWAVVTFGTTVDFTNSLPRKGMETVYLPSTPLTNSSLQTHCPARGWKQLIMFTKKKRQIFTNSLPRKGMETSGISTSQKISGSLYKLIAPQGDGNSGSDPKVPPGKTFTNSLPRKGMETDFQGDRVLSVRDQLLYKLIAPQGDGNFNK